MLSEFQHVKDERDYYLAETSRLFKANANRESIINRLKTQLNELQDKHVKLQKEHNELIAQGRELESKHKQLEAADSSPMKLFGGMCHPGQEVQ